MPGLQSERRRGFMLEGCQAQGHTAAVCVPLVCTEANWTSADMEPTPGPTAQPPQSAVFLCLLGTVLVQSQYSWDGPAAGRPGTTTETPNPDVCLTDHASCGCCLMQQQLYRMESFFNMSLNELQKDLKRAENVLNNITTTRSAFSVALTNNRWCLGPEREETTVVYQHVFINLGGSYNVTTGKFIAPYSGVYSFSLTVYSDAGAPDSALAACASLHVNGSQVASASDQNRQDQEDSSTTVVALRLNAGDKVHVKLPAGCFLCDNNSHYNTFTGFLLYATY
ncbi:uncharacterized protein LOC115370512 [Myripristis murdjan]|uniref:uncharacterized protein LOC115370512 n=1 Tax=Myripristis murdjan TaxID=586833 RepID=UPI0011760DF3|nr:uncharacterized protein LOC115370512 [Myripristis murdjan]